MKKSLLALAIGVAALPLVAQAAPEFYGRLNVSLDNVAAQDITDGAPVSTFGHPNSSWDVNSAYNWVGIKGDVPLYDQNLKAIYQIERGVDLTSGSGDFTARNTFVGLAGDNWGKLFLGTYDGVVKQAEDTVDQFNNTDADMALYIGGQNTYNHTINYTSPSFSGLSFNAQIIPGQGRRDAGSTSLSPEKSLANGYGASINFKQDTFWAHLAYEKGAENILDIPVATAASPVPISSIPTSLICAASPGVCADLNISTLRLTAGVNIGNINLALLAQQRNADEIKSSIGILPANTESHSRQDYMVSGSLAVTDRLKLKAQIADAGGYFTMKDDDRKIRSYTAGADYMLGKNVTSYVLYSNNSVSGKITGTEDHSKYNLAEVGLTYNF